MPSRFHADDIYERQARLAGLKSKGSFRLRERFVQPLKDVDENRNVRGCAVSLVNGGDRFLLGLVEHPSVWSPVQGTRPARRKPSTSWDLTMSGKVPSRQSRRQDLLADAAPALGRSPHFLGVEPMLLHWKVLRQPRRLAVTRAAARDSVIGLRVRAGYRAGLVFFSGLGLQQQQLVGVELFTRSAGDSGHYLIDKRCKQSSMFWSQPAPTESSPSVASPPAAGSTSSGKTTSTPASPSTTPCPSPKRA